MQKEIHNEQNVKIIKKDRVRPVLFLCSPAAWALS